MKEIKIRRFYTQQQVCWHCILYYYAFRMRSKYTVRDLSHSFHVAHLLPARSHSFHSFGGLIALTKRNRKKYNISVDNKQSTLQGAAKSAEHQFYWKEKCDRTHRQMCVLCLVYLYTIHHRHETLWNSLFIQIIIIKKPKKKNEAKAIMSQYYRDANAYKHSKHTDPALHEWCAA